MQKLEQKCNKKEREYTDLHKFVCEFGSLCQHTTKKLLQDKIRE